MLDPYYIISIVIALVLTVFAIECFFRLPVVKHFKMLMQCSNKALRVITSKRISDHWKERILLVYARKMALHSIVMGLGMVTCILLILVPAYLLDIWLLLIPSIMDVFISPAGLFGISIAAIFYLMLKRKYHAKKAACK